MELVRKFLTPDEIGSPALRWNSDCDCVQQTPDGGTTWVDVPAADPRSAPGYAIPPAASDDPRCDGAARMVAALKRLIDIVVSSAGSVAAVSAVLGYLADFLFGIGTLVALVLEAVTGMLALGQEALNLAFTSDVYDQIECLAFYQLGADGHFDEAGWEGFQSDVLAAFGGTVNLAMALIFQLEGINGFNNAASVGTETGDCGMCAAHCFTIDLTVIDGSAFGVIPLFLTDTWVSGQGWQGKFYDGTAKSDATISWGFPSTLDVINVSAEIYADVALVAATIRALHPNVDGYADTLIASGDIDTPGLSPSFIAFKSVGVNQSTDAMSVDANSGTNDTTVYITRVSVSYNGDIPAGWSDNC